MNTFLNSLTVLRDIDHPVFSSFGAYACGYDGAAFNDLLYNCYVYGAESDFALFLSRLILTDENAFARSCAKGKEISPSLAKAYIADLSAICAAVKKCAEDGRIFCGKTSRSTARSANSAAAIEAKLAEILSGDVKISAENGEKLIALLRDFYLKNGYGKFIYNKAFGYCGGLVPIKQNNATTLAMLKDYADEKQAITQNICNFLDGLPYSHMLLYGDRGTGKSSTIHAVVNVFADKKLRLVEVGNGDIPSIPEIAEKLCEEPMKFLLFLDDLSLGTEDKDVSALKSVLEGSFGDCRGNVMFAATSNRRHIVREDFADRQNAVHQSDIVDEQLSLADRFGLTIRFAPTDKQQYLSIVGQLADDYEIAADRQQLYALAERWAVVNGGRSPRKARQFAEFVCACEKAGRNIDF